MGIDSSSWSSVLEALAPLRLAADWDNVGLLVEGTREVRRIGLCVDLTEDGLAEVVERDIDLIVAYHPPIFTGVKQLVRDTAPGRVLLDVVRDGRHVYSPHTALDAVPGGVNDWLLEAFGELAEVAPLVPARGDPAAGAGRRATLVRPRSFDEARRSIARHLDVTTLQIAGEIDVVSTVAVCPGAGGSVLQGVRDVDLLLTGEMRHHDVLAWVARGSSVVLAHHTNTERGYLPRLAEQLRDRLSGVEVDVLAQDRDPLRTWQSSP